MHLLLTDRLSCPRCGPEFGLILLADEMENRRVREGVLGCPNCRDSFPVREGFGDLRAPPRRELGAGLVGPPESAVEEEVERLMALLGVVRGPGTLALAGGPAGLGPQLAARIEGAHVVGIDADLGDWPNDPAWSRIVAKPGFPFFSRTLRGVAVDGRLGEAWVVDAARACAPKCRVVVTEAPAGAGSWMQGAGITVLAEEAGTVVGERP